MGDYKLFIIIRYNIMYRDNIIYCIGILFIVSLLDWKFDKVMGSADSIGCGMEYTQ